MTCRNRGPFHLGISREACDNAGGRWYRSPCITLKQCIDDRPPRFQLEAPQAGSCQGLGQSDTVYVSSTSFRKVKIQLEGTNYLHMREVEVYDSNGNNAAKGKTATQSSNYSPTNPAGKAVDGNLTTISHTNKEQGKWPSFIFKLGITLSPLTLFVNF
jgi:hypothetical protein